MLSLAQSSRAASAAESEDDPVKIHKTMNLIYSELRQHFSMNSCSLTTSTLSMWSQGRMLLMLERYVVEEEGVSCRRRGRK